MNYLSFVIIAVILIGMFAFAQRAKQRNAVAESSRRDSISVGSEVMTTSGLYGTVLSIDEQADTVQLRISAGVEVKWAFAALRDIATLPTQYRQGDQSAGEQLSGREVDPGTQAGT